MSEKKEYMLTTSDNPYNYYTEFDEWLGWDMAMGYNTLNLLASVARASSELPTNLEEEAINDAINEIVTEMLPGLYTTVDKPKDD